jgi:hypothetical protein
VGIKGGRERDSFLNIWMVEVDQRFFARSWNKSERSWFTEFLTSGIGQLKYGEKILDVCGRQLSANDSLQEKINLAYLKRYDQQENMFYVKGITQPEYSNYTMEFFLEH